MRSREGAEATGWQLGVDSLDAPDVRALLMTHLIFARGASPPEDAHALDPDALRDPAVVLVGLREDGRLLGVGALRDLGDRHGEVKSMHVAASARGRGVGSAVLAHLLSVAETRGITRVSLETGSMAAFAPARALYTRAGFVPCPPFGRYRESPHSTYLTRTLGPTRPV